MASTTVCSECSISSVGGAYSSRVYIGAGNCANCVRWRTEASGLHRLDSNGLGTHDGKTAADRDDPGYVWGRPRAALRSSLSDLAFAKLLVLRGSIYDRRHPLPTPDPDGL